MCLLRVILSVWALAFVVTMERPEILTEKEFEDIKRMSDERIRSRLSKEGYDKDLISAVKVLEELLEMMVEAVVEKKREAERLAVEKEQELAWRKGEAERLAAEKELDLKETGKGVNLKGTGINLEKGGG